MNTQQAHMKKGTSGQVVTRVSPKDLILCPLPKSKVRVKHVQLC